MLSAAPQICELESQLAEDLSLLNRDIGDANHMPSPAVIRGVIAPILRKWVSDNGIKPLHAFAGRPSTYRVQNNALFISRCKNDRQAYWFAALPVLSVVVGGGLPKDPHDQPENGYPIRETVYDFNSFRIQKMAYNNGRFVTREQCVRFVADRMGGTHTTVQARPRKQDPTEFLELMGAAIDGSGNVQLMSTHEFAEINKYRSEGRKIFTLMHLIVLDTARRFCAGLKAID